MIAKRVRKFCAVLTTAAMAATMAPSMTSVAYANSDTWAGIAGAVIGLFGGRKSSGSSGSGGNSGILSGLSNQKHSRPNPSREEKLFLLAVNQNDFETVQAMLDAGVDIDLVAKEGFVWTSTEETAFMIAMYHRNRDMMQFLLERGANVNGYYTFDGKYVCYIVRAAEGHLKSYRSDPELIKYLHEWGANINGIDTSDGRYGRRNALNAIIARAAEFSQDSGDIACARYLVENGINLDHVQSQEGSITVALHTPFLAAVRMKWYDMAQLLADYGANLNAKDPKGKTALDIALEKQDLQYYKQIKSIIDRGQQPSKYQETRPASKQQDMHAAEQKKVARSKEYSKYVTAINHALSTCINGINKEKELDANKNLGKESIAKEYKKLIKENEKAIKTLDEETALTSLNSFTAAERAEFDKMRQLVKDKIQIRVHLMQYKIMDPATMSESDRENRTKEFDLSDEKTKELRAQMEVLNKIAI